MTQPIPERKKRLPGVIGEAVPAVQLFESLDDGAALLAACTKMKPDNAEIPLPSRMSALAGEE